MCAKQVLCQSEIDQAGERAQMHGPMEAAGEELKRRSWILSKPEIWEDESQGALGALPWLPSMSWLCCNSEVVCSSFSQAQGCKAA